MATTVDEPRETAGPEVEAEPELPVGTSGPRNARRYTIMAAVAVAAAAIPYLWVLWDLWTGTLDPLRNDESRTSPGSVIYDVQARAMLHGHLALPAHSIGDEAFIHDGRSYTYFGLFPSLIRMPVLLVTHALDGRLAGLSLLAAWLVTAVFTSLLVWRIRVVVRGDTPLGRAEGLTYGLLIFSVLAGSVLVSLASTADAYTEDEAWAVALACGSFFALLGVVERPSWGRVTACGALVLCTNLNRGTSGYAVVLATLVVAAWLAFGRVGQERKRWALPVLGAGLVALIAGCAVDVAKFNVFFGYPVSEQLLYRYYHFAQVNGGKHFSVHFLPATLDAYLSPGGLRVTSVFPYLSVPGLPGHLVAHTPLFNRGNTASVPASMPLLFLLAIWGIVTTFTPHRPVVVRALRILILAAGATAGAMLIYGTIYERFLGDFLPLLILAGAVGLVDLWRRLGGARRSTRVAAGAGVGALALFGFVANMGIAVVPQMNWTSTQAANYVRVQKDLSDLTGHPLSNYVLRGIGSFPSRAPMGALFIDGRCHELDVAYEASPDGFALPWLPVEHAPDTPICRALYATARNVTLVSTVLAPANGATVSGPHVVVNVSSSGVGQVHSLKVLINKGTGLPGPSSIEAAATRVHHGWQYVWDTEQQSNGIYTLRSIVATTSGSTAVSPGVTVTVQNPAEAAQG